MKYNQKKRTLHTIELTKSLIQIYKAGGGLGGLGYLAQCPTAELKQNVNR